MGAVDSGVRAADGAGLTFFEISGRGASEDEKFSMYYQNPDEF